jgi:diguanylate cyclase (GGDEF)-like protein
MSTQVAAQNTDVAGRLPSRARADAGRGGRRRSIRVGPVVPGIAVSVALAVLFATSGAQIQPPVTAFLAVAATVAVVAGIRLAVARPDPAADRAVRSAQAGLRTALAAGSDAVVTVDRAGVVREATDGLARLTEYTKAETVGAPFAERIDPGDRRRLAWDLGMGAQWRGAELRIVEFRMLRRDFTTIDVEATLVDLGDDPVAGGTMVTLRDIAEQRLHETDLRRQTFRDQLTGLPNRGHFFDRVEHALERSLQTGDGVAILYLDLDGFKRVNDSLGHAFGDRVLTVIGERLSWSVRGGDMVARLGGDEFAVLLEEAATQEDARLVAERIQASVATPISVDGRQVRVGVSVGVALSETLGRVDPAAAREPIAVAAFADELVRNADVAMYEAKQSGKGGIATYEQAMRLATVLRLDTETALREAVDEHQFVVHYQPIVDLATGQVTAMEALARWRRPGMGLVAPSSFISIAEETGLVRAMGAQLLEAACRTAASWPSSGPVDLTVNLSPRQIQDPLLVGIVERALVESGLDPRRLVFEITESLLLDDGALTLGRLDQLRSMGIRFAIDDFGTGYSSLSYIEQLPVDILKIDRAFVVDLATNPRHVVLLRAIVAMAGAFGLTTVAEGVETPQQLALVRDLGCDTAQGFLLAAPTDGAEATALLVRDAAGDGTFGDVLRAIPLRAIPPAARVGGGAGGGRGRSRRNR